VATLDVRGAPTLVYRQFLANLHRNGAPPETTGIGFFRIGEGGFLEQAGGTRVPKNPDDGSGYSLLTNVEAPINLSVDPGNLGLRYFQKALTIGDLSIEGTTLSTVNIRCLVLQAEANATRDPEFFEIGVFNPAGVMICYGTFPQETKNLLIEVEKNVKLTF